MPGPDGEIVAVKVRHLKQIDAETPSELARHLIVDNYGTHKRPCVKSWLRRHPRFHLHFIPTSSSWLNLVERWFRDLTTTRIRRGSFRNVRELIVAIKGCLAHHNQNPRVSVWTASVEHMLIKVAKCKEALDDPLHLGSGLVAAASFFSKRGQISQ